MGSCSVMGSYGVVWVVMNLHPTYRHMYPWWKINDEWRKSENYSLLPSLIYVFFSPSLLPLLPLFSCKSDFPFSLYNLSIFFSLVFSLSLTTIPTTAEATAAATVVPAEQQQYQQSSRIAAIEAVQQQQQYQQNSSSRSNNNNNSRSTSRTAAAEVAQQQ